MRYFYGSDGVAGFLAGGTRYYYQKNAQGDVIAILTCDGSGNNSVVATYVYDAFGNHKVYDTNGNENFDEYFIGNINPIRYRSYYYDIETGLYYLQARYYDPEIGRFISPDSTKYLEPTTIGGLNLYAYCNNNPIMYVDPSGHSVEEFCVEVLTNIVIFIRDIFVDAINYNENNTDIAKVYKSQYFSSYNGTLVIRHSISGLDSWSIGGIIFLNHNRDDYSYNYRQDLLNHEYGHILQEKELGTLKYFFAIAIPSVTFNLLSDYSDFLKNNYYNMPWEYDADMRGGVSRPQHNKYADYISKLYMCLWRD
jgi:RHS repeat-associated protein